MDMYIYVFFALFLYLVVLCLVAVLWATVGKLDAHIDYQWNDSIEQGYKIGFLNLNSHPHGSTVTHS